MRRLLLVVVAGGVLLLANWVQAPAAPARSVAAPSAADVASAEQTAQSVDPVARQIDQEAERLRQRLAERAPFAEPVRNPFRFNGTKSVPKGSEPFSTKSVEKGSDPLVLKAPAPPPIEMPTLIGLTEDTAAGVETRSAVLTMGDEMAVVKVGQTFSRFIVQSIGLTSVELVDVTSPSRLAVVLVIR